VATTVRDAELSDLPIIERLWRAFERELSRISDPPWLDFDIDQEVRELAVKLAQDVAVVAEDRSGRIVGFAFARRAGRRLGVLSELYVDPALRGGGAATMLVSHVVARLRALGLDTVQLEVLSGNQDARAVYARWGFREHELTLVAPLDTLARRLGQPS
jgi:ribosomal protein S18 acetylase RimI-like enzyme